MKLSIGRIRVYPWHSVNLIPQFAVVGIVENEPPYKRDGSLLELVLFGHVIHILVPLELSNMSMRLRGPIWSKKKKKWYRAPK